MQTIPDEEYHDDNDYGGLSPFAEEEPDLPEPEELPEELKGEVYLLAAIAVAQLIPTPGPATTYASGIGLGLLRQSIARRIENYWREHRRLPSGCFEIEGHKAVQLPELEK